MNDLFTATPREISEKTWRTRPSTAHAVYQYFDNGYLETLCGEMFKAEAMKQTDKARHCLKCEEKSQRIWVNAK